MRYFALARDTFSRRTTIYNLHVVRESTEKLSFGPSRDFLQILLLNFTYYIKKKSALNQFQCTICNLLEIPQYSDKEWSESLREFHHHCIFSLKDWFFNRRKKKKTISYLEKSSQKYFTKSPKSGWINFVLLKFGNKCVLHGDLSDGEKIGKSHGIKHTFYQFYRVLRFAWTFSNQAQIVGHSLLEIMKIMEIMEINIYILDFMVCTNSSMIHKIKSKIILCARQIFFCGCSISYVSGRCGVEFIC